MARNYRELVVWQKAMAVVTQVYRVSSKWPAQERFGLIPQARRCAVSVASNIAEGEGRGSDQDFVRFLWIAHGSLRELETPLLIAEELEFSARVQIRSLLSACEEVGRMIQGLIRRLRPK